ncbi:MAG: branched-chain amino acid ABC transporter permease [Thermoleophilia bacterium]|nr:branched-chain amino acid ABC transporter permease [Thermoleophilia bacterium]
MIACGALAVTVAWLASRAIAAPPTFVIVTLNGLTIAALYFVVASGFNLIFGLMRFVNMAHGSLYLLGGYVAFEVQQKLVGGNSAFISAGDVGITDWLLPLAAACGVVGLAGLVLHQVILRRAEGQELRQAVITIAVAVVLGDQMLAHFGGVAEDIRLPEWLERGVSLHVYGVTYSLFRLVVLAIAIQLGLALVLLYRRTRFGTILRAGVDDREMVEAIGINIQVVFAVAFGLGAVLAGLGGVLGGTMVALAPGEDSNFLLKALIVVIVGGLGSLAGSAVGALALGLVEAYAQTYLVFGERNYTYLAILLTFGLLIVALAARPEGLLRGRS